MKRLKRLLCVMGFHKWNSKYPFTHRLGILFCDRCDKKKKLDTGKIR